MKAKNAKHYLNVCIGLALMLLFPLLPPVAPVTEIGMSILGIFLGMLWLWIMVDGMWPSILALLLVALSGYVEAQGYAAVTSVFSAAFGNATVLLILLYMILFGPIGEIGLAEKFAAFLLRQKFLEGRPYLLIFMIVLCSYLLGGLGDVLVSLFIMWPIVEEICRKCGTEKGSSFWNVMVASVFLGSVVGQPMLPFKGLVAGLLATISSVFPNNPVNMSIYLPFNFIMAFILFVTYTLMVRLVIRPDVSALRLLKREDIMAESSGKMTPVQILYTAMLATVILGVMLPSIVPSLTFLSRLGVIGIVTILFGVAMVLRDRDGKPLIDIPKSAKKTVNWNMIFSVVAAIYMSSALVADSTGIKTALASILEPVLGNMPTTLFVVLLVAAAIILTNAANNQVVGVILITLLGIFQNVMSGLNITGASVMIILSVCLAFLLPSGSIYCSVLHSRKDLISFKEIQKVFVPTIFLAILVYSIIGYPLAALLFR